MSARRHRRGVIAAVLILLGIPVFLALVEAASYGAANRSNGGFVSSGERREYLLYVPKSYDRTKPTPLVISLHAAALWGAAQQETSQWNRIADRERFIVVYPSGVGREGPRMWREDQDAGRAKDVAFISALIDTIDASYNIDPARVYANGLSNGGGMAFVLSCLMSHRIAAVGLVGAAQLLPWGWCQDATPVPMIDFHGTSDPDVPYAGGRSWVANVAFPDQRTWVASWARRNHCAPAPMDSTIARDVTRRVYRDCSNDASVVLYTILGGGHTWPGGKPLPEWFVGRTTTSIDASAEMWAFFRQHRLVRVVPH